MCQNAAQNSDLLTYVDGRQIGQDLLDTYHLQLELVYRLDTIVGEIQQIQGHLLEQGIQVQQR